MDSIKSLLLTALMVISVKMPATGQEHSNAPTLQQSNKTTVYCFSGLGADERAFARMRLPEGYKAKFIQWIRPKRDEVIEKYALRLLPQIDTTRPCCFIGLSFGGMVALEIAKRVHPRQVILISSLAEPAAVRGFIGFLSRSGLYRIFPFGVVTLPNKFAYEAFGAYSQEGKKSLSAILMDTSVPFFRWAVGQMTRWKGAPLPPNTYRIHGDADRIIPIKVVQPDIIIRGGGHLAIFEQADEVNAILARQLRLF